MTDKMYIELQQVIMNGTTNDNERHPVAQRMKVNGRNELSTKRVQKESDFNF